MKRQAVTPVKLRIALVAILLLLAAAGAGVFAYGYNQLKSHALAAQETATKAEASRSSLQSLITTKKFLADNADAVERASQLASESKLYVYQDQIISDINKYANESGIQVISITFDEQPTSTNVAAPPTGTDGTAAPASTAPAAPTNVKSITASVAIKNPVSYNSMLTFVHLIEQSLFRMQMTSIGISNDTSGSGNITSNTLTIEAYIR